MYIYDTNIGKIILIQNLLLLQIFRKTTFIDFLWCIHAYNFSLRTMIKSSIKKETSVCLCGPLLKKPSLDPILLDNFCSISHLSFLGKIVKKVVALELQQVLNEMDYLSTFFNQVSGWIMGRKCHNGYACQ